MLPTAAVGPPAAGRRRRHVASSAVFTADDWRVARLASVGVQRRGGRGRSLARRTAAPAARHFRLMPAHDDDTGSVAGPWRGGAMGAIASPRKRAKNVFKRK